MTGLQITITITPQGQCNVTGPLEQPIIMYGALKIAETTLAQFYAKQANGSAIVAARPADALRLQGLDGN
jgi:hypothetical protein